MGIFDFFKKKQEASDDRKVMAILDKVDPTYRQTKAHLDYQNSLLSRVNAAREKYKKTTISKAPSRSMNLPLSNLIRLV